MLSELELLPVNDLEVIMVNNIYSLHKRIMKGDSKAINEIETLEEAKEIIRMLVGSTQWIKVDNGLYHMDFDKAVEVVVENSHRWNSNGV